MHETYALDVETALIAVRVMVLLPSLTLTPSYPFGILMALAGFMGLSLIEVLTSATLQDLSHEVRGLSVGLFSALLALIMLAVSSAL